MNVVVLTGAGISAESGVPTFRDSDGLWEGHDVMEVASPEGFRHNPSLVQRFYDLRRAHLAKVRPNAAHQALARLERSLGDDLLVITQNVDDLHERAGSRNVLHMHGELRSALCLACGERFPWERDLAHAPPCPGCTSASLRPDVVWFGEMPYRMDEALYALQQADLFVAVGTSAQVQPAAAFVHWAAEQGARTMEINLASTLSSDDFDESRQGPAGELVPRWVDELLRSR
ncbi:NAD-dependent deacylase [Nocardioides sp. Y6]|uniref:NAD-dependent protein deacylase n=1 Tax=Nocardioides malaquae TaxID=2773426 RepID=A0ABR9RRT4_9ACTN|nr:NAD-dependent deacylase [Nocardioides malaquae]MBE7324110.1 NAD-dependent deacylase [Nocardioides malaquae]